jgi:hypothetical protein
MVGFERFLKVEILVSFGLLIRLERPGFCLQILKDLICFE